MLGKVYCDVIRKAAGIAVDIGHTADVWAGVRLPGLDQTRQPRRLAHRLTRASPGPGCEYHLCPRDTHLRRAVTQSTKRRVLRDLRVRECDAAAAAHHSPRPSLALWRANAGGHRVVLVRGGHRASFSGAVRSHGVPCRRLCFWTRAVACSRTRPTDAVGSGILQRSGQTPSVDAGPLSQDLRLEMARLGRGRGRNPRHELVHVPLGLDHDRFRVVKPIANRPPRIAMMYGNNPLKGTRDGLEALTLVKERIPKVEVTVFGKVPPRNTGLPDGTTVLENPSQERLRGVYNGSGIYLCPSISEGFGFPSVEAMACGCALVTTSNGGWTSSRITSRPLSSARLRTRKPWPITSSRSCDRIPSGCSSPGQATGLSRGSIGTEARSCSNRF